MVTHQLSYLYSLTEDEKEERAEDEGAEDEGADDEEARCDADEGWQMFQLRAKARASNVLMTPFIVSHEHHVNV